MASETRQQATHLEKDLLENGAEYDYYQAVRLIALLGRKIGTDTTEIADYKLKVTPKLSFDYPSSDISDITVTEDNEVKEFSITTTFMGLYGVSSPLPAYFTEELLDDEWNDIHAPKGFVDVIHQHLYPLLYKAWLKYKFSHNAIERNDSNYWSLLFSLIGIGTDEIKSSLAQPERLIRYTGLLAHQSKSTVGLHAVLQDYLHDFKVDIEPCINRTVTIPLTQRLALGTSNCVLGEDTVLGSSIVDRTGKFRIKIGSVNKTQYQKIKSDPRIIEFVNFIVKSYLQQPLEFDLLLTLSSDTAQGASLGEHEWSRLGYDTWLGNHKNSASVDMLVS